jgi:hypothetical protein
MHIWKRPSGRVVAIHYMAVRKSAFLFDSKPFYEPIYWHYRLRAHLLALPAHGARM